MCLLTEGQSRQVHECTLECPICWIFLYPAKQQSLVSGEKLQLGTVADLMRAVENGCQLSSLWLQLILESEYGPVQEIVPQATDHRALTVVRITHWSQISLPMWNNHLGLYRQIFDLSNFLSMIGKV